MYCGGGAGGKHFHSDIKNCCMPALAYTSYCLHSSLQQVFTKKKNNPVGINWAPKILIYTVHLAFIGNKIPFLIQPFQVTGLSGFQFPQRPHKITQIVLGMTIITSLLTA